MDKQIFGPPIPYMGSIYKRNFSPGKMIRITGVAPGIAQCFNVNLQCGGETAPQSDVAMRVSVQLLDDCISLNSLRNGVWGEEQCGVLPIKRRNAFEIILICDFNQYKVVINRVLNGQRYYEFPQRIHYARVTHLAIDGDVAITQISYELTTRSELNRISRANASVCPLLENEDNRFQIINTAARAHNEEVPHLPPSSKFSEPPSYDAALDASNRPPYPTNNPIGMPNLSYEKDISSRAPYPTCNPIGMPHPDLARTSPYPPACVPLISQQPPPTGIYPPSSQSRLPVSRNVGSSNVEPVINIGLSEMGRRFVIGMSIAFGGAVLVIMSFIIFLK